MSAIRDQPAAHFDLEELARKANLSASHLRHLFKSETGFTPARFVKQVRLEQAAHLLGTTFLSVKEVMNRVGITNESYFSREFKKVYGVAPGEFRNAASTTSNVQSPS